MPNPQLNQATPRLGLPANTYGWSFAPLGLNRQFSTTITGLPATIPPGVVTVTAQFSFVESGITSVVTDAVELLINRGGPAISVTLPTAGSIQSALYQPIRLQGNADDPEGVSSVQVCVKTTPVCTESRLEVGRCRQPVRIGLVLRFRSARRWNLQPLRARLRSIWRARSTRRPDRFLRR